MEIKKFFNRVKELISKLDVTEEDLRDDIEKEPVEESIFDQVKSFNLKKYEKEKFLGEKRDYVEDFKKYYKYGISGGTFIESILSVALDGRKASCCFQDQFFENPAGFQSIQQVETIAKEMKKDYNIFMDLVGIPMDKGCMILIFFFKDIKTYEKLKKLQTDIENIKTGIHGVLMDANILRQWGQILDYPQCCIDFFIGKRLMGGSAELENKKQIEQLKEKIDPHANFSFEFYPCKCECKEAQKIGKNIENKFLKEDVLLAKSFQSLMAVNIKRIMTPNLTPQQNFFLRSSTNQMIRNYLLHPDIVRKVWKEEELKGKD